MTAGHMTAGHMTAGQAFCHEKYEKAAEQTAIDMGKQIGKDLDRAARRAFHDADHLWDRTMDERKQDATDLYDAANKAIPNWMRP